MLVIDLERAKTTLNETYDEALGWWTKTLLRYMYGDDVNVVANLNEEEQTTTKFKITGKYQDVKSYAIAVGSEKEFLDAFKEFGEGHPQTMAKRQELRNSVADFERITGLKWPFKDED
tara:strand:+ start:842 stop:1195 length:354 start_codon:yes stop_codon:yes gene_type:complete